MSQIYPKKINPSFADLYSEAKELLIQKKTTLLVHYYVDETLQKLADETGGIVSDSLEMARFGKNCSAQNLVVAGVRFMGETAKILTPNKTVLMPTLEAECSLDLSCPADKLAEFIQNYPNHTLVVYANTSAKVKAMADWVVTSSVAVDIIKHLTNQGKKIIWAPDKHLGSFIETQIKQKMVLWDGSCIVHDQFKAKELIDLIKQKPNAKVLAHPECPKSVLDLADFIGSTSQIIQAAIQMKAKSYIVATERGIFYKIKQTLEKEAIVSEIIEAPNAGDSATCKSCAVCPWMEMNCLEKLIECLKNPINHEIKVDNEIAKKAMIPINKMLDFAAQNKKQVLGDA